VALGETTVELKSDGMDGEVFSHHRSRFGVGRGHGGVKVDGGDHGGAKKQVSSEACLSPVLSLVGGDGAKGVR
jgi:hypothetical protein